MGIKFPMPQSHMSQLLQQRGCEQMRMLLKESRIAIIGMNGASAEIMLRQDTDLFALGEVLPAIGQLQINLQQLLQRVHLHGKA
jgi:hypothetical protein